MRQKNNMFWKNISYSGVVCDISFQRNKQWFWPASLREIVCFSINCNFWVFYLIVTHDKISTARLSCLEKERIVERLDLFWRKRRSSSSILFLKKRSFSKLLVLYKAKTIISAKITTIPTPRKIGHLSIKIWPIPYFEEIILKKICQNITIHYRGKEKCLEIPKVST